MNIMQLQQRNLWIMAFLLVFTGGLYYLYWLYKTKQDINKIGGKIPTFWLAIVPLINFYFNYRYAEYFVKCVRKSEQQIDTIVYFLLMSCLPGLSAFIVQYQLNNYKG